MMGFGDCPSGWASILAPVFEGSEGQRLLSFLQAEEAAGKQVYPPRSCWLAALEMTPLDEVKVVILGQDPYHGAGQAHGLAFSVRDGIRIPPSLLNIYKELETDLGLPRALGGNLAAWARQGVLLLNTVLTVEAGRPASHRDAGWEVITTAVIEAVVARARPSVFMLWGGHAQKAAQRVAGLADGRHLVLSAAHPSPLSARNGFFGCRHFSQANAFLDRVGRGGIDWSVGGMLL